MRGWKWNSLIAAFAVLCLATPCTVRAEGARQDVVKLGDVVVTATRTETPIGSVPASVTVISRDDIEKSTAQSADELLEDVVGVFVRHPVGIGAAGTNNIVYMRGLGGKIEARVLVLKDGVPINDPQTQSVEWNEINIDDIERIEIVRGPGSALYGSNAMGGVINIITRKPAKKLKTTVEGGYGSLHTWYTAFSNSDTIGKFGYYISGRRLESDGYCETPDDKKKPGQNTADVGTKRDNYSARLTYEFDPASSLAFSGSHHRNERSGKYNLIPDFNLFTEDIDRGSLHFKKRWGGTELLATVFSADHDTSYDSARYPDYDTLQYVSKAHMEDFGGSLQVSMGLGENHILTVGTDYKQGKLDKHYDYETSVRKVKSGGKQQYLSFFLQDEMSLLNDRLICTLGGRYDWWKNFGGYSYDDTLTPRETKYEKRTDGSFDPKLGVLYHLTGKTSLRGAVGKAFRSPTLNNLYRGDWSYGFWTYRGNPDLGPEKLWSYELGIDQKWSDGFTVKTTIYQTNAKDFIYIVTTDAVNGIREYNNIGKVRIRGVEVEADYRPAPGWFLYGNYSYNESKIREFKENTVLEGKYLPWIPKWEASIGVTYSNPRIITAGLTGHYVGVIYDDDLNKKEIGNYFTMDLKLSRKITKNLEASLEINDLTDKTYQHSTYSISPGRTVMGNLKFTF